MSDAPETFGASLRKARKNHYCCECHVVIYVGETYEYASGVWDHQGASFKTCMPCAELRKVVENDGRYPDEFPAFKCLYDGCAEEYP